MAVTWQTPGALLVSAASATSISPAYPAGSTEGDKLLLVVGQRPSTVNSGSVSTPSGWNLVASKLASGGYGTTFAADRANTNLYVFERTVPAGGLSGTLTVSVSTNNVCWAQILRLTTDNGSWDSVAGTTGENVTGGTAVSIACAANPGVTANDAILTAMCIPTDGHTGFSGYGATQSGITFGTWTQRSMTDSGTGNDIGGFVATCLVSSGTATGAPTITATAAGTTTNVRGPGAFVRVREGALAARTGTMSATETGPDTIASSGGVVVHGSASATETGEDTFAASGGVSSGVSGSMAVTEQGADAFAGAGTVPAQGSLAVSELGADTAAASGTVAWTPVIGSMAAAEAGHDVASATGQVFVSGAMAATEDGPDTMAAMGQLLVSGLMSVSESGFDAAAILGAVRVQGSASMVESGQDTFFGFGGQVSTGSMAATEAGQDQAAASGLVLVSGSLVGSESGIDGFAAVGVLVPFAQGDMAAVEAGDDAFYAEGVVFDAPPVGQVIRAMGRLKFVAMDGRAHVIEALRREKQVQAVPRVKFIRAALREKQVNYEILGA